MKKALKLLAVVILFGTTHTFAQDTNSLKIVIEPDPIVVEVGAEQQLKASLVNEGGETLPDTILFYSRNGGDLEVSREGYVKANKPGTYSVLAMRSGPREQRVTKQFNIDVPYPPIAEVQFKNVPENIYSKTTLDLYVDVIDEMDLIRENPDLTITSDNQSVAMVSHGKLMALKEGKARITAESEGKKATLDLNIKKNPATSMVIDNNETNIRTGDVITLNAKAMSGNGREVNVPITYSFVAQPEDNLGQGAEGQISQEGKFVANKPGIFTLTARSGDAIAEQIIRVEDRNVAQDIEMVGHGEVLDVHTSDLWIWEGVDGRDYAITGTWGANGDTYFWDVTDPSNIVSIDTVRVDARTVNDVKISEDGTIGIITREGASDRKNGMVVLDVSNPSDVKILSEYNEGLTGGVHNAFIYEDHVYAVNNGRRYDIINIEDPENPYTVGRFELDTPGHSIHDVWIEDGIAYSSNWRDGVVAVDIGSQDSELADAGGSPENPVMLGSYSYPSGRNHAAFPFKSESTGDFYVIAGDESFPYGLPTRSNPVAAAGWIHFIKFDGWDQPKEVARYQVPEAGTHNFWVVGDLLFVAYYNAGLRIVDISGELMGNLYDQGREIAKFEPTHPDAIVPNAPFTWGPQPYKGHIFISDWNSGLWAIKLVDRPEQGTN
ncbi:LVIVD repeat-containing protein [Gracilimonas halophila]|uniref:LVIVD repeat-containing protein n=1 Tax=Gracilimonas halophila TaxID=1834464 RepID=A0ABW5JI23_9BACT